MSRSFPDSLVHFPLMFRHHFMVNFVSTRKNFLVGNADTPKRFLGLWTPPWLIWQLQTTSKPWSEQTFSFSSWWNGVSLDWSSQLIVSFWLSPTCSKKGNPVVRRANAHSSWSNLLKNRGKLNTSYLLPACSDWQSKKSQNWSLYDATYTSWVKTKTQCLDRNADFPLYECSKRIKGI